jgi:phage/plasmid-like protein (TIGR03299 family)
MRENVYEKIGGISVNADTFEQIAEQKGLNWTASKYRVPNVVTGEMTNSYQIIRDDNNVLLNSSVGKDYGLTQPKDLFTIVNAFSKGEIKFTNAGELQGGKKIFVQAEIGKFDLMASGDVTKNYMSGVSSFDGTAAESYKQSNIRIVCQNTFFAVANAQSIIKLYHRANIKELRQDALKALQQMRFAAMLTEEVLTELAKRQVSGSMLNQILRDIYGIKEQKDLTNGKAEAIATAYELFESNDNNAFPQFRGTAYNLFNAVTEREDHFKAGDYEKQAVSALFGTGNEIKERALEVIIHHVQNTDGTVNELKSYSMPGVGTIPTKDDGTPDYLGAILN